MRSVLPALLTGIVVIGLAGCKTETGPSPTKEKFNDLYMEYSARFHEKMVGEAENMTPGQVAAEAARIWNDVFSGHEALIEARLKEIMAELRPAKPFDEEMYVEVASGERVQPTEEEPKGIVARQLLWNPVGAAQMALSNWISRLLNQKSRRVRQFLMANAPLFWTAQDRDISRPVLQVRQGPMIFTVQLTRHEDYYQVDKIRWLRPKSMGPLRVQEATGEGAAEGEGEAEGEATEETTPPAGETGTQPETETPEAETPETDTQPKTEGKAEG